jgi:nucleotide-binding universal stress UspA family protein
MSGIQRILVPTDFSPTSDIALQYAIDLSQRLGSNIHLLHVIDDSSFTAVYPEGVYFPEVPEIRDRLKGEADGALKKAASRCSSAGVQATTEVVNGLPARTIAQTAKTQAIDLIVMGTHGRGAFAHMMLGSVAERVVRIAPCAVLTVRDSSRLADVLALEYAAAGATATVS